MNSETLVINTPSNPVTLFLEAGTYYVTPIGISDGGLYNAWDANITDAVPSWVNAYSISSDEFSAFRTWDSVFYTSDLLALSNASSTLFTLTKSRNVNFFNADSFHSDNGNGMSLLVSSLPSIGLVADYPFNGNANDGTGNGNDGVVNGAQLSTDRFGRPNSAFSFDGVDDFIGIGNGVKPPMPLTVNLWFNAETIGRIPLFRNDRLDGGSFRNGVFVSMFDNKLAMQILSGFSVQSTRKGVITANDVFEAGEWTMMTAVFESVDNFRIYVNGSEQNVVPSTGTGNSLTYSTADGAIGSVDNTSNNASAFSSNFFDGSIDDVRIYNQALSDSEIRQLFQGEIANNVSCGATFQNRTLHIPCVDVVFSDPFGGTATITYKADLQHQLNSNPITFVLSEAQQIDKISADNCVATYKIDGILNIPCVSVFDIFGGTVMYEADMELIPSSKPFAFKLIEAKKKNN